MKWTNFLAEASTAIVTAFVVGAIIALCVVTGHVV